MLKEQLEKFRKLPKEIIEKVSSEQIVRDLEEIEKKHDLSLAKLVILVMIKEIKFSELESFLEKEFKVNSAKAISIKNELEEKIFKSVLNYLTEEKVEEIVKTKKSEQTEVASASLDFEEDEEEIRKIKQQLRYEEEDLDELLEKAIKESDLIFEDEVMKTRFKNIILAWLKEIRDFIEMKEALVRSKETGGMGMSEKEAEEILKKIIKIIKESKRTEIETKIKSIEKEIGIPSEIPIFVEQPPPIEIEEKKKDQDVIQTVPSPPAVFEAPFISKTPISTLSPTSPIRKSVVEETKIRISDIKEPKATSKLIGPIEELRELDLNDWRKLAKDPRERTKKIEEKISLLEEESIEKKVQAVRAWKESETVRVYLEIGQESIEQGRSIVEIINNRLQSGQPTLTLEEFEAITDLHQRLKF